MADCTFRIEGVTLTLQTVDLAEFQLETTFIYPTAEIYYRYFDDADEPISDWILWGNTSASSVITNVDILSSNAVCRVDFKLIGECPEDCPSGTTTSASDISDTPSSSSSASSSDASSSVSVDLCAGKAEGGLRLVLPSSYDQELSVSAVVGAYVIHNQQNPTLTFHRGVTYSFKLDVAGHPFYLQTTNGSGYDAANVYSDGFNGNGETTGTYTWTVPSNAPDELFYQCQYHTGMNGSIAISDLPSTNTEIYVVDGTLTGYFKQISIDYPNMVTINDDNYAEITDSALMLMVIEMGGVLGQDYCPSYLSDCSTFSNGSLFGSVTASNITIFRIQIINAFINYIVYNSVTPYDPAAKTLCEAAFPNLNHYGTIYNPFNAQGSCYIGDIYALTGSPLISMTRDEYNALTQADAAFWTHTVCLMEEDPPECLGDEVVVDTICCIGGEEVLDATCSITSGSSDSSYSSSEASSSASSDSGSTDCLGGEALLDVTCESEDSGSSDSGSSDSGENCLNNSEESTWPVPYISDQFINITPSGSPDVFTAYGLRADRNLTAMEIPTTGSLQIGENITLGYSSYGSVNYNYTVQDIYTTGFNTPHPVFGLRQDVTLAVICPNNLGFSNEDEILDQYLFDVTKVHGTSNHWSSVVPTQYLTPLIEATARWGNLVAFNDWYIGDILQISGFSDFEGIRLNTFSTYSDSSSDVVVTCYPHHYIDIEQSVTGVGANALTFDLSINEANVSSLTSEEFLDVMTQALGHALGIGVFWDASHSTYTSVPPSGNILDGDYYSNTKASYNNLQQLFFADQTTQGIPLDPTDQSHWSFQCMENTDIDGNSKNFLAMTNDVMIGQLVAGGGSVISDVTLGVLDDFMYELRGGREDLPVIDDDCSVSTQSQISRLNVSCKATGKLQHVGTITKKTV